MDESKLKTYQKILEDIEVHESKMRGYIDDLLDDDMLTMEEKAGAIKALSDMLEEIPSLKEDAIRNIKKYLSSTSVLFQFVIIFNLCVCRC